jgi:ribosomal protein S18 acetylase RimI-like enzyme
MKSRRLSKWHRWITRAPQAALRLALPRLPVAARKALVRASVDVPAEIPADLVLKIATSKAELEGAFRLVHDAYVAEGFMKPDPSRLRATKFHLLPTTTTLIAKIGDDVVATLSVVQDGAFGVPMDAAFDLSELRRGGRRMAEISSLAVAPAYRRRGTILWLITKLMLRYSVDHLGLDLWVASANPKHNFLYESVWNFRRLACAPVAHYAFANGAPAVPWYAELDSWMLELYAAYGECKPKTCLPRFYNEPDPVSLCLPNRPYRQAFDHVMTPELVAYFFPPTGPVMAGLTAPERELLGELNGSTPPRRSTRFHVACRARMSASRFVQPILVELRTISSTGFAAKTSREIPVGTAVSVEIAVGDFAVARVAAVAVAPTPGGILGFSVTSVDSEWQNFLAHLEKAWQVGRAA